jgi:hypothetical protein
MILDCLILEKAFHITFAIFYLLEGSYQAISNPTGGDFTMA